MTKLLRKKPQDIEKYEQAHSRLVNSIFQGEDFGTAFRQYFKDLILDANFRRSEAAMTVSSERRSIEKFFKRRGWATPLSDRMLRKIRRRNSDLQEQERERETQRH